MSNTVSPRKKITCIVFCKQNKFSPTTRFLIIIIILHYYFSLVQPNLLLNLNMLHLSMFWSMKTFVMLSIRTNLYMTCQNPIFTYPAISNNEPDQIHWLCSQSIKVIFSTAPLIKTPFTRSLCLKRECYKIWIKNDKMTFLVLVESQE
jgi:hypothetical protein